MDNRVVGRLHAQPVLFGFRLPTKPGCGDSFPAGFPTLHGLYCGCLGGSTTKTALVLELEQIGNCRREETPLRAFGFGVHGAGSVVVRRIVRS